MAEGLSDLDEYDMECEVITDNPAGEMKEVVTEEKQTKKEEVS